ncbi:MAG TPA: FG-GAP-like repeat-containing protein [candidate division Zixibacteria bacterium]|nr:FG-GAP-like repeat-containing protein [candidate division Zixibacteria bacterium]
MRAIIIVPAILLTAMFTTVTGQVPIETVPFWQSTEVDAYSTGMIWEDANGDGYIDLFVSNGNDMNRAANTIYLSHYGELATSGSWYSSDAEYSGHCAVGDLDGNGFPEFFVSNYIGQSGFGEPSLVVGYYNFTGLPQNSTAWHSADSFFTFSCALGDVDNDGDLDLAVATGEGYYGYYSPEYLFLNENGILSDTACWQSNLSTAALDVCWGDYDNDGDLDLAVCDESHGAFIFNNNNGSLESNPGWQCSNPGSSNTVIFGYVNDDRWLDLVVAFNSQLGGHGKFCAYLNDGAGSLHTSPDWESADGGYGSALSLYDYDNDGDNDLAAGRWYDRIRIYENIGGTFVVSPTWQASPSTVAEELSWIDIDGDGLELFVDTFAVDGSRRLFYLKRQPIQIIDSIIVDGARIGLTDYCHDLRDGWISLAAAPVSELLVYYQYSFKNDLTVVHWDTCNMAFANTNDPLLDFYVDVEMGWAPFTVNFSDSSAGSSNQVWDFGDGQTGAGMEVSHMYESGGAMDVSLEADLADGYHHRRCRNMVVVLADTIYFEDIHAGQAGSVVVPVYLKNSNPLSRLVLPISYAGDVTLSYAGFDTIGCRTNYFNEVTVTGVADMVQKVSFRLTVSGTGNYQPPLSPGDGPIINLHFNRQSGFGAAVLDSTSFSGRSLDFDADYASFVPAVRSGTVTFGIACGDINGSGTVADISDLVYLVDYMFNSGLPPASLAATDVNGSGSGPDIADLVYMVDYMFNSGPDLDCGF